MASLQQAHLLLRNGREAEAVAELEQLLAMEGYPELLAAEAKRLHSQIAPRSAQQVRSDPKPAKHSQAHPGRDSLLIKPYRCTVIAWDVNHNCLGRAYIIAKLAQYHYKCVDLIGFDFPHLGSGIWEPLRSSELCVTAMPCPQDADDLFDLAQQISERIETDLVIACKPRLPSLLLGCMIKQRHGVPLIVDIDDYEIGFLRHIQNVQEFNSLSSVRMHLEALTRGQEKPYSDFWTCYADRLLAYADGRITSNTALQHMYGGCVIPHVRSFCDVVDGARNQRKDVNVVMFLGTPRRHKGVVDLAKAVAAMQRSDVELVFVGSFTEASLREEVERHGGGRISFVENIPFEDIQNYLSGASVSVLLQDPTSPASMYQLPAKAIDALSAGVQIVATRTQPLEMLVAMGFRGIHLLDSLDALPTLLTSAIDQPLCNADRSINEQIFRQTCSYEAGAETLATLIRELPACSQLSQTIDLRAQAFGSLASLQRAATTSVLRSAGAVAAGENLVVMLWKQNDIGLFGRRVDMVARYLASRADVDHVFLFEKPLSSYDIQQLALKANEHHRLVYRGISAKRLGLFDSDKMSVFTPLIPAGIEQQLKPQVVADYISAMISNYLLSRQIKSDVKIRLWVYPYYEAAPAIIADLHPDSLVVDIVDDHTKWPGITEEEAQKHDTHYQKLLQLADYSLYNCEATHSSIGCWAKGPALLIPNGVDTSLHSLPFDDVKALRSQLLAETSTRYIAGYVGNLESKLDWDLVSRLAKTCPDLLLLFVGSTHMSVDLPDCPNIVYTGPVPYPSISHYLSLFNVGIVPHRCTSLTNVMNPLKLYVYSCFSFPVVSTNIPNLPPSGAMPQLVVASDHADFIAQVKKSLVRAPLSAQAQALAASFVRQNSWESRLRDFVDRCHGTVL